MWVLRRVCAEWWPNSGHVYVHVTDIWRASSRGTTCAQFNGLASVGSTVSGKFTPDKWIDFRNVTSILVRVCNSIFDIPLNTFPLTSLALSSVLRSTLSLWWRVFQVYRPTRALEIHLMKEFFHDKCLILGTTLNRVTFGLLTDQVFIYQTSVH